MAAEKTTTIARKKFHALEFLAQAVADYINEGFEITSLTGEGGVGGPCHEQLKDLHWALRTAGLDPAASQLEERFPEAFAVEDEEAGYDRLGGGWIGTDA